MKKLSQLLESINEIDSLLEIDFKDKEAFQKYQSIHKMKPTTKVNIAGKDTTVGDEMGDDSETPQAPKKTTGADIEKQADKSGKEQDDIEKDIAGDLMGDEPKGDTTADTLTKGLKDGGLNPYKDGPMINQALDDIGGDHSDLKKRIETYGDNVPSSRGKSEAQYQKEVDKYKEEGEKLSNDIVNAVSDKPKDKPELATKIKDGKIKSSGPQQFADDVKNLKGDYDLDGVKIKDGKMFNADGEEMDADEIEDFYYQDAFDEDGRNVGIDIKEKSDENLRELSKITTRYTNRLDEAGVPNHLRAGFKKLKNEEGLSIEEKDELTDAYRKLVDLLTYGKFYENGKPNQRRKELSELTFDIQYALVGSKRLKPQNSQSKFESIWKKFTNMINTQIKIEEKGKQGNYIKAIRASQLDDVVSMFKRNTQRSTRKQKDLY